VREPLDGAKLKIVRAEEHLNALKLEVGAYLDTRPYEFIPNSKMNPADPFKQYFRINTPPPLHCGLIIGDIVTNIRAALDYIVWELSVRFFVPPFNDRDRQIVSFPIYENPGERGYTDRMNGLAKRGVPAGVRAEIDAVQPHKGGYGPLGLLNHLVNTDKHRVPLLAASWIPCWAYNFDNSGNILPPTDPDPGLYAALQAARLPTDPVAMRVYPNLTVYVSLEDATMPREPVDRTLENIIKTVADVIPRFEQFFA
jgi:hypothetical protein